MLTYLEESAMLTCEHLQIGRVDKDAAVDVLQAVPAQVESLQAAQLVEYARSEFLDLWSNAQFDSHRSVSLLRIKGCQVLKHIKVLPRNLHGNCALWMHPWLSLSERVSSWFTCLKAALTIERMSFPSRRNSRRLHEKRLMVNVC